MGTLTGSAKTCFQKVRGLFGGPSNECPTILASILRLILESPILGSSL